MAKKNGTLLLTLALGFAAGCGPPPTDFSGTWKGTTTSSDSCGGGPPHVGTYTRTITIEQSGSNITVNAPHCSPLKGTVEATSAHLNAATVCPEEHDSQGRWTNTYTLMTFAMSGATLVAAFQVTSDNHDNDGSTYTCTSTETGNLTKQ